MTNIEWTDESWNPVVGCTIVSPGCTNCYAMKMAARLEAMHVSQYAGTTKRVNGNPVWTGKVETAPEKTLMAPIRRRKPTMYFVNSMGDLFHEDVPDENIGKVFAVMALANQHIFQVLTKRSKRMREWTAGAFERIFDTHIANHPSGKSGPLSDFIDFSLLPWPLPNIWLGVSAEDQERANERIPDLQETLATVRFVSAEPLLGPIDFSPWLNRLDWIIAGAESGSGARPMKADWAINIKDQCAKAGTKFFMKQLSGPNGKAIKDMERFRPELRIREMPA